MLQDISVTICPTPSVIGETVAKVLAENKVNNQNGKREFIRIEFFIKLFNSKSQKEFKVEENSKMVNK
jgi:hypothetical protein